MKTRLLLISQCRFVARNVLGTLLSVLGIALGVMSAVAVHLVGDSVGDSLGDNALLAEYDHVVTARADGGALREADYLALRARWQAGEWPRILGVVPVLEGIADVGGVPVRVFGFDPIADWYMPAEAGPAEAGPAPSAPDEAGVDAGGAGLGMPMDEAARFLTTDHVLASSKVLPVIEAADRVLGDARVSMRQAPAITGVVADLPTAERILSRVGEIDSVWLRVDPGTTATLELLDKVFPGIAAVVETKLLIDGFTVLNRGQWNPLGRFTDAILFNLGALSGLALLVAAYLVFQAAVSRIHRQRLEVERLVMIGIDRRWLLGVQLIEAALLGLVSALAGLAAGTVAAHALTTSAGMADIGPVDAWLLGKSLAAGMAVAILAAWFAHRPPRRLRPIGAAGLVLAVAACWWIGGLPMAFLVLLLLCVVQTRIVVPIVAAWAGRLVDALRDVKWRMSARAVAVRFEELRLSTGALSIAVAVAMGMTLMVDSLRRDFLTVLDARLWPGLYISTAREADASSIAAMARQLAGTLELDVRRYGRATMTGDFGGRVEVTAARTDAVEMARYGYSGALTDAAIIGETAARFYGIAPGDVITLSGGGGSLSVRVMHVFADFGAAIPRVIVPRELLTGSLSAPSPSDPAIAPGFFTWDRISIHAPDAALRDRLVLTLAETHGHLEVRDHDQLRSLALTVFERTFAVSRALTGVVLAVAVVSLVGSLLVFQLARGHEFRLLEAVGLHAREMRRMVLWQSLVLGAVATASAIPLGLVIAWVLCAWVNPAAFGWSVELTIAPAALLAPLAWGLAGALLAGLLPAHRVAR